MRTNWIRWSEQPLGTIPDSDLASRLGVSKQTVARARRREERRNWKRQCRQQAQQQSQQQAQQQAQQQRPIEVVDVSCDDQDTISLCRDDRCSIVEVHYAHAIPSRFRDNFYRDVYRPNKARHGEVLREILLEHIDRRRCKVFSELYDEVVNDYGPVLPRTLYRALKRLVETRKVTAVTMTKRYRSPGGYVRSDSPLLRDHDGYAFLLQTLEDAQPSAV